MNGDEEEKKDEGVENGGGEIGDGNGGGGYGFSGLVVVAVSRSVF